MFQKITFVLLSLPLISCVHTADVIHSRYFIAPKEEVWKVLVSILRSYPLKTIDEKKGYIETEELKVHHFWIAPHKKNQDFSGYSSVIRVNLKYNKPASWVYIDKKVYKQKGFISSKEEISSDRLEENLILYRIARELKLRSLLDRIN